MKSLRSSQSKNRQSDTAQAKWIRLSLFFRCYMQTIQNKIHQAIALSIIFRLIRKMLERRIKNEIPNKTHIMQSCIHLHSNSRMRTMGIWVSYSSCCCTFDRLYFWFYNTSLSFLWEALFNCTNSERSLSILRKIIRVNILWKQWVFHAEINVCAIKCQPIIGRDLYSL